MPPEMLPLVLVLLLTDVTLPRTDLPVTVFVIRTLMPGRTRPRSLGLSWPTMAGLPIDSVTSAPLAVWPTLAPMLARCAGNRGTNMNYESGIIAPLSAFGPVEIIGAEYPMLW